MVTDSSSTRSRAARPGGSTVIEFFAGIGLMRAGLEQEDFRVVWANDIDANKRDLYAQAFGSEHFVLGDIRTIAGGSVPQADVATASFPCTDLSLAGARAGLAGHHSGTFWEFTRILREQGTQKPRVLLIENVIGFASSRQGADLVDAIDQLNTLGYSVDPLIIDACHFVPQSRPRLFLVCLHTGLTANLVEYAPSELRPDWIVSRLKREARLRLHSWALPDLPASTGTFDDVAERLPGDSPVWWDAERTSAFRASLSRIHARRLEQLMASHKRTWRTAYRRTREGRAVWEIRKDHLAGCLRTARGGSSKQAVVEAGAGSFRVRWMTPREYASLQGAPSFPLRETRDSATVFGFGDAVCVPVVSWIARHYLSLALQSLGAVGNDGGQDALRVVAPRCDC